VNRSRAEGRSDRIVVNVESDIQDLVPGFLANRRSDVQRILEALSKGDFDAIRIMAHSMKGAGGGYGFETISEIGAAMEQGAKQGNSIEIERWLAELRDYLERVDVVYV
jgi:histidine phosphotransfer protein HptB